MKLEGKFAVVTGGGSGIGLAITRALRTAGAYVLIVGRNPQRLAAAQGRDTGITTFVADLAKESDRDRLARYLAGGRPLEVLVNNAGTMTDIDLHDQRAMLMMEGELAVDLSAPIHLTMALLPTLLSRPEAAVVNVSTGLIYAPFGRTPGYATAKAGVHAFSQTLRHQTRREALHVLEVLPPTVDTELTGDYGGSKIKPDAVGSAVVTALINGTTELRVGQAKFLYAMARMAPNTLFTLMNKVADNDAAKARS
ncbi:SDR family oxidoreductase [Nocardia alni]|uniref:SDR family oxidoreductase n=1 Tax=Nocardia alni TaxID=2815723 RepID=UPI001C219B63|nr:SDR family NAD(P)-dependent oxidoreductase [Nocardia alni]